MTEGVVWGKGYLKPILRDPTLEKMNKKSIAYRYKLRRLACIMCTNIATQMKCYDMDGAIVVRR